MTDKIALNLVEGIYNTQAEFLNAHIPLSIQNVSLISYADLGKGGHIKKRVPTPNPVKLWHSQSADGAWWEITGSRIDTDMFGADGGGIVNVKEVIQAAVDLATLLGVRAYINNGTYNCPGLDTPSNCIIEWAPLAWIRPLTYSPPGAVVSNKIYPEAERPYARENITLINPQVDGSALSFVGPGPRMNDNGIGFATGVKKIRVYGGHINGFIANFEDGPGGKGFGVEQGVSDVMVFGTKFTNCTYPTFVSSHIFDNTKLAWDISFHDLKIEKCATVAWLLAHDPNAGAVPTTDSRKCSAAYYNITALDCGHFPDRNSADYRQKAGAIVIQNFSNLIMRGIKIANSPGYPNATYPAGGTKFPTGFPALGETRVGAGMTGPGIGAVIWGMGRNWDLDIDFTGECDDIWNIQRPQAHSAINMGSSVAPQSVFGMAVKVVYRGSTKGLINSGVIAVSGTLAAGSANTVTFPVSANLPTRDEGMAGVTVNINSGAGAGQSKRISTYNATTRVATIEGTFSPAPDATSTFDIGSTRAVADANINGFVEIVSDTPSISLVSNLARFPTNIKLIARSSSDLKISASFLDVFSFNNSYTSGSNEVGDKYTPTLTGVTNITSSTSFEAKYIRMGKVVIVYGLVTFTPTAASLIELDISLPFPSNLATTSQAIGTCGNNGGNSGTIISNATDDRARMSYTPTTTALQTVAYSFAYNIT